MDVRLHRAGVELDARRMMSLDDAIGARIVCVAGELWITQHRDATDHFVCAGGSFTVTAPGKVLIQAQRPARVMLVEPDASPRRDGFARWLGVSRLDGTPPVIVRTHGA